MGKQQELLSSLEGLKKKASEYARTDRIGHVFARSFDLIEGTVKDGVEAESVRDLSEMLTQAREYAKKKDSKDPIPLIHAPRDLVYGLFESLGAMSDLLSDRTGDAPIENSLNNGASNLPNSPSVEPNFVPPRVEPVMMGGLHKMEGSLQPLQDGMGDGIVKEEELEMETALVTDTNADVKEEVLSDITMDGSAFGLEFGDEEETMEAVENQLDASGEIHEESNEELPAKRRRVSLPIRYREESEASSSAPVTRRKTRVSDGAANRKPSAPRPKVVPNNKPFFPCEHCEYGAPSPAKLLVHVRSHTGERPFKCVECDEGYVSKSNLYRHLSDVHKQCRTCNEKFANVADLKKHSAAEGH